MPSGAASRSEPRRGAGAVVERGVESELVEQVRDLRADPALPITRCPRSLANCAARLPTAPAAADTQTMSPSRNPATSKSPAYAVRPMPPSGPRYRCGGARSMSSRVSVPSPPSAGAPAVTMA